MSFWESKDFSIFLVLVPVVTFINYFITFYSFEYNAMFWLAFLIATLQGYCIWFVSRFVIIRMERKKLIIHSSGGRLLLQFMLTSLAALITAIFIPDCEWYITGEHVDRDTHSISIHDLVVFLIWILIINGIYVAIRYYDVWKKSEARLEVEKSLKTEGISVKIGDRNVKVQLRDICGFFVEDGLTYMIDCNFKTYIVDSSLDNLEQKLPERYFFRVNRKYILHRNSIVSFKRIEDSKLMIATLAEKPLPGELPMSRLKAPSFKKWFEQDAAIL
jgi:hypothetical protein